MKLSEAIAALERGEEKVIHVIEKSHADNLEEALKGEL